MGLVYQKVEELVSSIFHLRKTRMVNLVLLTAGIIQTHSPIITEIARSFPVETKLKHRVKRAFRFLANPYLQHNLLILQQDLAKEVLSVVRRGWVVVSLDWTSLHPFEFLSLSLQKSARTLPLMFDLLRYQELKDSTNRTEERLIEAFAQAAKKAEVPLEKIVLLADRGFSRASLFEFLDSLGLSFVIRLERNVMVWIEGGKTRLKNLTGQPGEVLFFKDVGYRQDKVVRLNLLVATPKDPDQEIWYLATNLESSQQAKKAYESRMWEEETFRDFKSAGFDLEKIKLNSTPLVKVLILAAILAMTLTLILGLWGERENLRALFEAWGKLSIFRLGFDLLRFRVSMTQRAPPILVLMGELL